MIHDPEALKGKWKKDGRPLFIELGMGKGRFIIEKALLDPDTDFIGVERYESVLFRACRRMEGVPYSTPADKLERSASEGAEDLRVPDNLKFLSMDAALLPECFEKGEIDRIYLNFSDPWPKARHSDRRLTSPKFLGVYAKVLKKGGYLEFKTDNTGLFDFSLESVNETEGWTLESFTYDLHADPEMSEGNVMTEYERKFSALGNKICKLVARLED